MFDILHSNADLLTKRDAIQQHENIVHLCGQTMRRKILNIRMLLFISVFYGKCL